MTDQVTDVRAVPTVGIVARTVQAARYVISGVTPSGWFSALQPLRPLAPQDKDAGVVGRQFDYPTGMNLNFSPRSTEAIGFDELRALSYSCDVLRAVIEARKDQLAALDWVIRVREYDNGGPGTLFAKRPKKSPNGSVVDSPMNSATTDQQERIKAITQFLQYPDREHSWDQWARALHEERFVIDAATLYRRRTRGGKLYALELIDGSTIQPLINDNGRRPQPPSPGYQQILKGVPAVDYTMDELLYLPRNIRVNHLYGYSPVEQVVVTVNTAIRRSLSQLEYYREGSVPDAWVGLPPEWTLQKVKDFQMYMDSLLSGNLAARRKVRFMPGNFKYQETKSGALKDDYDEWLARIICYVFSTSPEPFIQQANRSSSQTSRNRALEEGLMPDQRWFKQLVDRVITEDFGSPDLEFAYLEDREQDPSAQANIDVAYAKAGVKSIDEVRQSRGLDPIGGPYGKPMLATAQGYVEVGKLTSQLAPGAGEDGETSPDAAQTQSGTDDAPHETDHNGVKQTPGEKPPPDVASRNNPSAD